MPLYEIVKEKIQKNKEIRDSGKFVGIPYPFERLREFVPVIEKGQSIGILAGTGTGKSRLLRFLFLYHIYDFSKRHSYPVKIYYFPLEDNKEKVYLNIYCHYLKKQYNIHITPQELSSKTEKRLSENVIEAINNMDAFFEDFEKYVIIKDDITHPKAIYGWLKREAEANGRYEMNDEGHIERYIATDNVHRIVLIDNLSNFDTEKTEDERTNMVTFCKYAVRKMLCNTYDFTVVQVMQMSFDKERQQFTNGGASIISKLEPSLDGIGEAKVVARSMHIIFGLFNPDRYEILMYPNSNNGYNIGILQDKFRALKIIKSNDSPVGNRVGLYFDAIAEELTELPSPKDQDALNRVYSYIKGLSFKSEEEDRKAIRQELFGK